jgi:hypothetical protein
MKFRKIVLLIVSSCMLLQCYGRAEVRLGYASAERI